MHLSLGLTLYRLCLSFSSSITISSTSSYVCHCIIPSKIIFLTGIKLKSINPSYLFLSILYIKKKYIYFPLYISVITTIDFLHTLIFLPPNDPSCLMHHNPCIKEKWEFSLLSFHHRHGIWFPITIPRVSHFYQQSLSLQLKFTFSVLIKSFFFPKFPM